MRGRLSAAIGVLLFVTLGPAGGSPARAADAVVTYLSGSTVYVNAGERDGLEVGARLLAAEEGRTAVIEVFEATSHRSACRVVSGLAASVSVGAVFRYEASPPAVKETGPAPAAAAAASAAEEKNPPAPLGIHGRAGVRYLITHDGADQDAGFQQPALDLRLNAPSLRGSPWGFQVDVRARRTLRGGEDENRTRVYALLGTWDPAGAGWRVAVGRQYFPELAEVSLFDGVSAAWDSTRWSAGGFAGTQPDVEDFGASSDVKEYGGFFGWRSAAGSARHWSLNTGFVASTERSTINREYLFARGLYTGARVSGFITQEVDVNRGWKKDAGESSLEPTSTFLSVRVKATPWLDALAGFDNRRNVRLYRDYVSPETDFDDASRRGIWAGGTATVGEHFRAGLSARVNRGGDAGSSDAWTGTLGGVRLTRFDLETRLRATRYETDKLEGTLLAVNVSGRAGPRVRIGVEAGQRVEDSALNSEFDDTVQWYGASVDVDIARRLWGTLTFDHSRGDREDVDQLYASLAWRF